MTSRWRRLPSQTSPLWIAAGGLVTGVTTYVALAATARAVGAGGYDAFSFFWSALLIAGFGAFLPVEQVLARRRVSDPHPAALLRDGMRYGAVVAVLSVLVVVGLGVAGGVPDGARSAAMAGAFVVALAGYVVQFAARGTLAGGHLLRHYATVVTLDAAARTVAVVALGVAGVRSPASYAGVVAGSALLAGLVGGWLVVGSPAAPDRPRPLWRRSLGREAGGLSVAMLCMQALLNSPVLIAGAHAAPDVSAGELLAIATLARLAVFVAQAAQASYVGRIAAAHHHQDGARTRHLVELVGGGAVALAALTVLGGSVLGPSLVRLLFGGEFDVTRTECALVAAGVGAYVCASVANDISVALDRHARAGVVWLVATALGATMLLLDDPTLRATLPLVVGSVAAGSLILAGAALERPRTNDPKEPRA